MLFDCNPTVCGEVMPDWTLAQAAGGSMHWRANEWALCLRGDVEVTWKDPCPILDPLFDMSDDAIDALPSDEFDASIKVIQAVRVWGTRLHYVNGMRSASALLAACVVNGWDVEIHGSPETWLAQRVAKALPASGTAQ